MEKNVNKSNEYQTVDCQVCLAEIPKSAANSVEASDYVQHFCGIECYSSWATDKKSF